MGTGDGELLEMVVCVSGNAGWNAQGFSYIRYAIFLSFAGEGALSGGEKFSRGFDC